MYFYRQSCSAPRQTCIFCLWSSSESRWGCILLLGWAVQSLKAFSATGQPLKTSWYLSPLRWHTEQGQVCVAKLNLSLWRLKQLLWILKLVGCPLVSQYVKSSLCSLCHGLLIPQGTLFFFFFFLLQYSCGQCPACSCRRAFVTGVFCHLLEVLGSSGTAHSSPSTANETCILIVANTAFLWKELAQSCLQVAKRSLLWMP